MGKARNIVLSGLYSGKIFANKAEGLMILLDNDDFQVVNETSVNDVEAINQEGVHTDVGSSIARGIVGGVLLGGAGLVAGTNLGEQNSINILQITWNDGQKSLVEVNENISIKLQTILWNVKNNIKGNSLTKEEILQERKAKQESIDKKNAKESAVLAKILAICMTIVFCLSPKEIEFLVICLLLGFALSMGIFNLYKIEEEKKSWIETFFTLCLIIVVLVPLLAFICVGFSSDSKINKNSTEQNLKNKKLTEQAIHEEHMDYI